MSKNLFLVAAALLTAAPAAFAQPAAATLPLDHPYPGELVLQVDLRAAPRKVFYVRETIPVSAGDVTLDYPQWIPGEHSPSGPVEGVAGLKITGNGAPIRWRRDRLDMFKIHLTVPQGVSQLRLEFQFLSPTGGGEFGQSVSATPKLVALEWNQVAFYPDGFWSRDVHIAPSVLLPSDWQYATALEANGSVADGAIGFKTVGFNTLVDSPLIAGVHFRRIDLDPGAKVPVHLDLVADAERDLKVSDQQIAEHRALVQQAYKLFGSHHYDHYDFLFVLSDNTGHFGLEHHQSSDDRIFADFFTDPSTYMTAASLLPHEYTHSWNGKFRRPADLWTPNFNVPMKDDLLWVYEGLTNYWGDVLAARSGMRTPQQARDALAATAAAMQYRPGRTWRPLQDTADEAQILYYAPGAWANWRRQVDFYPEGELIWLDVDTKIRELTHDRRSLDDFAKRFYGIDDGSYVTRTYRFDDVVAALDAVAPYDWAKFFRRRLDSTSAAAPLDGLRHGGWQLTFTDQPSEFFKASEKLRKDINLFYSLGIDVDAKDGELRDVLWGGPAFAAGLAPGMHIVAVDEESFTPEAVKQALVDARHDRKPIRFLVKNLDYYRSVEVPYYDGPRYPHLERLAGAPDRLGAILRAH
ncbi:MAG: M61 family metallopeptidase [Gammaproteobacteria bacterium]|nr:M61 family metallopeptidase [Gammaproteobacteria bacterium]